MARLRIVLVGEDAAGIQALRTVARAGHDIVAVMASPSRRGAIGATLWQAAQRLGYPTWPAACVKDPSSAARLRELGVDLLLNVHSLFMIHPEVVSAPRLGSFNLHPGPLPRYAGLNAVSWALSRGERIHGVTLHHMDAGCDTGPIAGQTLFTVEADESALSVSARCVRFGLDLVAGLLRQAADDPGSIPAQPQDLAAREYFGAGPPDGGVFSWNRPARDVVNLIRACDYAPYPSPWGPVRAGLDGRELSVLKAFATGCVAPAPPGTVGLDLGTGVVVACGDEWIIVRQVGIEGRCVDAGLVLRQGDRLDERLTVEGGSPRPAPTEAGPALSSTPSAPAYRSAA